MLINDIVERGRSHVRDTMGIKVRHFGVSAMLGFRVMVNDGVSR